MQSIAPRQSKNLALSHDGEGGLLTVAVPDFCGDMNSLITQLSVRHRCSHRTVSAHMLGNPIVEQSTLYLVEKCGDCFNKHNPWLMNNMILIFCSWNALEFQTQ